MTEVSVVPVVRRVLKVSRVRRVIAALAALWVCQVFPDNVVSLERRVIADLLVQAVLKDDLVFLVFRDPRETWDLSVLLARLAARVNLVLAAFLDCLVLAVSLASLAVKVNQETVVTRVIAEISARKESQVFRDDRV